MGVAERESQGLAATLEHVEQVAASRAFSGGVSLPRLLRYLAQRAVAEPAETIKEFESPPKPSVAVPAPTRARIRPPA